MQLGIATLLFLEACTLTEENLLGEGRYIYRGGEHMADLQEGIVLAVYADAVSFSYLDPTTGQPTEQRYATQQGWSETMPPGSFITERIDVRILAVESLSLPLLQPDDAGNLYAEFRQQYPDATEYSPPTVAASYRNDQDAILRGVEGDTYSDGYAAFSREETDTADTAAAR